MTRNMWVGIVIGMGNRGILRAFEQGILHYLTRGKDCDHEGKTAKNVLAAQEANLPPLAHRGGFYTGGSDVVLQNSSISFGAGSLPVLILLCIRMQENVWFMSLYCGSILRLKWFLFTIFSLWLSSLQAVIIRKRLKLQGVNLELHLEPCQVSGCLDVEFWFAPISEEGKKKINGRTISDRRIHSHM